MDGEDDQPDQSGGSGARGSKASEAAAMASSHVGAAVDLAASSPKRRARKVVSNAPVPNASSRTTRARNSRFVVTPQQTVESSATARRASASRRVGASAMTRANIES